jgi:hypothetical protein
MAEHTDTSMAAAGEIDEALAGAPDVEAHEHAPHPAQSPDVTRDGTVDEDDGPDVVAHRAYRSP